MEKDYNRYIIRDELKGYIEYTKKNNSVQEAFKYIFKNTKLNKKEQEYISNHERCIKWVTEYNKKIHDENIEYVKTI